MARDLFPQRTPNAPLLNRVHQQEGSAFTVPKAACISFLERSTADSVPLHLFFLELDNFNAFRSLYGEDLAERLLMLTGDQLAQVAGNLCGRCNCHLESLGAGQYMMLCEYEPGKTEELPDQAIQLRHQLKNAMRGPSLKLFGQDFDVLAGYAVVASGVSEPEACLYKALCDAQRIARGDLEGIKPGVLSDFREVLDGKGLTSLYQPIVNLANGNIFAWEALTRGPVDSLFHSPVALFDFAEEIGEIFALEKACRVSAIHHFGSFEPGQKLFLNIHPRTLIDPDFCPGETLQLLDAFGLKPENIVFEITERHAISDFTTFHRTLDHYRGQGYMIAVDDVGTGYSGLWSIAELRPDFLKIDMSFIRGIDANPVKRALLETFVSFSEKIGCKIIAEGIETSTELSAIIGLGAHFGQGFHLSRPDFPKPGLTLKTPAWQLGSSRQLVEAKCSIPIRDLAVKAYSVPPDESVRNAKKIMAGEEPISSLVVCRESIPVGLIMSHHLDRALSSPYGMSLYYNREVSRIMDANPLVVDWETPVETVAQRATNRDTSKIYDHIITTRNNRLHGIISVQRMLDALAAVQVEMAKGINPLSGLPGNLAIEREIEKCSRIGQPFSIIYADLDNFKAYNDAYGFKNGDNILLLISRILTWASSRHGRVTDFTGHVGGDDFVLICSPDHAERICKAVVRCFQRLVRQYYSDEDRERGYIRGNDRSGILRTFPLVSVSLAIIDCRGNSSLASLAQRSAEMKKYAKTIEGNSYVRDRRSRDKDTPGQAGVCE